MSDCSEYGKCDICKKEGPLERTYFQYDIKCECHSPNHFELIIHCKNCRPIEPKTTKIILKTEKLSKRKIKLQNINKSI
jgi:hypothetical protein